MEESKYKEARRKYLTNEDAKDTDLIILENHLNFVSIFSTTESNEI